MKEIVNRAALYVTPKEPFIKWAKYYDESPEDDDLKDRISEKHIFLIEEFYLFSNDGISKVLEPYWEKIFEYELTMWNAYKNEWPQQRTLDMFLEWFNVKICEYVFDMDEDKKIEEDDVDSW